MDQLTPEQEEYHRFQNGIEATRAALDALRVQTQQLAQNDPARNAYIKLKLSLQGQLSDINMEFNNFKKAHGLADGAGAFTTLGAFAPGITVITELADVASKVITAVKAAKGTASFSATLPPTPLPAVGEDRGNLAEPLKHPESLMTVDAQAYLRTQIVGDAGTGTASLRDISLIHFFERREPAQLGAFKTEAKARTLHCSAQADDTISGMVKGSVAMVQTVTMWENNTKLMWYVDKESFDTLEDAAAVGDATKAATDCWNKIKPGGVWFEMAPNRDSASFFLGYEGPAGMRTATGFFPDQYVKGYSRLSIHENALETKCIGNLSNYILHQLGHILGFRHAFILEAERRKRENESKTPNPVSVMSLHYPPRIAFSDIVDTQMIYEKFSGGGIYEVSDTEGNEIKFRVARIKA